MDLKPINQIKLYGLDKFLNELINLYSKNNLPNKILFTGLKGTGKCTLAFHLINFILSIKESNAYNLTENCINSLNRSFILVNNNTHPNFFLIDVLKEKKNIDINQIRKLIDYMNKSNFNDLPRIILIDNIELLNLNSINALLKVLEEPGNNIHFILINNDKRIIPTLKSRCLNFKIDLSFKESLEITNKILNLDISTIINKEFINYYNTPGDYYNLISYSKKYDIDLNIMTIDNFLKDIIDNNKYKKDSFLKNLIYKYIEIFFMIKINNTQSKSKILNLYNKFVHKIDNSKKFNLDEETLFLEFKSKVLNG